MSFKAALAKLKEVRRGRTVYCASVCYGNYIGNNFVSPDPKSVVESVIESLTDVEPDDDLKLTDAEARHLRLELKPFVEHEVGKPFREFGTYVGDPGKRIVRPLVSVYIARWVP